MNHLETMLRRNSAIQGHHQARSLKPAMNAIVLSCLDARADPAHFLGLEAGDALVLRNAGGRVTQDVERQLALLAVLARQVSPDPFELVIVHHTDCGMEKVADGDVTQRVSAASGVPKTYLDSIAIPDHDHATSLRADLERLQASTLVPRGIKVVGIVYQHDTGAVEVAFEEQLR